MEEARNLSRQQPRDADRTDGIQAICILEDLALEGFGQLPKRPWMHGNGVRDGILEPSFHAHSGHNLPRAYGT